LRLAVIYPFRYFAANGGLASYGFDPVAPHQEAGHISMHPEGEKPGNLPVQAPSKYESPHLFPHFVCKRKFDPAGPELFKRSGFVLLTAVEFDRWLALKPAFSYDIELWHGGNSNR
jgi:hypothetical protein